MTGTLRISPDLSLPLEAVTEAFAVLAVSGAGKSNAGVVLAEELYDNNLPFVAVDPKGDWWGIRSSADGKSAGLSVVVFGGEHGDVPLEPTSGRYIADLIVDRRLSCVLDVSEMTKADLRRFLQDFAERLYKRNREPLMVILEEADEYIPQMVRGDTAKLVGAMETLVKRGRFRGIGTFMVTQRSASLNNDVLTQARNLFAMQTTAPPDKKAVLAWISHHTSSREVVDELPQLQPGEAWFFSPAWMRTLTKIRFRRRRTYDSGATPKIGEKRRPPARLADVDLAAIKEAMADTIERAKADDPKELRKRIAELERHRCPEPATVEPQRVEIPVVSNETTARLWAAIDDLNRDTEKIFGVASEIVRELERVTQPVPSYSQNRRSEAPTSKRVGKADEPQTPVTGQPTGHSTRRSAPPTSAPRASGSQARPAGDGTPIGKGERVVLRAVAQYDDGVTREQLTVLTGYKRSTRDAYIQRLRQAELVTIDTGRIVATTTGVDALGDDFEPLPTGAALREHWLATLPEGESRILAELLDAYPAGLAREVLSDRTEYKRSTRDAYLQRLRARQLVTTNGDPRAADVLFESA